MLLRCRQFNFYAIRIFEKYSIVSAGKRVVVGIEQIHSSLLKLLFHLLYMFPRAGVEGKVIQSDAATMKRHVKVTRLSLDKYDVGVAKDPTPASFPGLVELITQFLEKPSPEFGRFVEIADINFNMVQ